MTPSATMKALDTAQDVPPDPREPMTDVQAARLRDLSDRTGESYDENLTMQEAERRIADLEDIAW
ncbi:DUF3072 domain-containing protein [Salipiger mucosus]|uniref:DUF3072 domain-containing protein n=1 Tax=Salipiger mucosus DSM 16094 TaxID=1123237 RepID=S9S0G7_9RHOB|nr:DUF3072 domain-containing protein [Salipiger mucosus]EPX79729.1 hypothetical protein Salmuc_05672 [Salipiger mucosus DSM 16094]